MDFSKEALIAALVLAAGGEITITEEMLENVTGKEVDLFINNDTYTLRIE